jgi:hypothetical protein
MSKITDEMDAKSFWARDLPTERNPPYIDSICPCGDRFDLTLSAVMPKINWIDKHYPHRDMKNETKR